MATRAKHANTTDDSARPSKRVRVEEDAVQPEHAETPAALAGEDSEEEEEESAGQAEPLKASDLYLDTVCIVYWGKWITSKEARRSTELYWTSTSRKCALSLHPTSTYMAVSYAGNTSRAEGETRTRLHMPSTTTITFS